MQDLESQISSFGRDRGKRLKAAQAKQVKAKAGLEAARAGLKQCQAHSSQAVAEMEAAEGERGALQQQLQAAQAGVQGGLLLGGSMASMHCAAAVWMAVCQLVHMDAVCMLCRPVLTFSDHTRVEYYGTRIHWCEGRFGWFTT